jgi:glycine oxidase
MERVGFAAQTTDDGIATVRAIGEKICPILRTSRISASWAGLRPVTPDLLPILGSDPDIPNIVYACGHSRNGILLTPLTAEVVADVVTGTIPRYDLAQFRPDRF